MAIASTATADPINTPTKISVAITRLPPTSQDQATTNIVAQYGSKVWDIADILRGIGVKASDWPNHMMPFFTLMLLESRALRARKQALETFGDTFDATDPQDVADLKAAYIAASGSGTLTNHDDLILHGQDLKYVASGGPAGFSGRLRAYLEGYDDETRRLLGVTSAGSSKAYMNIEGTIRYLESNGGDSLWRYGAAWAAIDLTGYDSSAVTTLEEHIKRRWADISADTAGEQYTPADLIALVAALSLDHFARQPLDRPFLKIYDPTCGGGNMLFGVEDALRRADGLGLLRNKRGEAYSIQSFGQELNDNLFALSSIESRFRPSAIIKEGNTLTADAFSGELFDLIVANPPYGNDWKQIAKEIKDDETGRFPEGCRPPVSDGQHLFLQHIQAHLAEDGLALVFCSGSTLFSGDAGGGESNARSKYILTDDGVAGIIQLPKNEFFNTGINTYLWIFKKGKADALKNRLFLLNAESLFSKLRKSLGSKNSEIDVDNRYRIVALMAAAGSKDLSTALLDEDCVLTGTADGGDQVIARTDKNSAWQQSISVCVTPRKMVSPDVPALLRLLDGEQVHYNKVFLELTRGGAEAFSGKPIRMKKVGLRVFLEAFEEKIGSAGATMKMIRPGDLWIGSDADVGEVRAALEAARIAGALAIDAIPAGDAKAIVAAIKQAIEMNPHKVFNTGGCPVQTGYYEADDKQSLLPGYSYQLPGGEDQVVDTRSGKSLGVGIVGIKVKIAKAGKGGGEDRIILDAEVGPKIEKDTETTPYHREELSNTSGIQAFLDRWVRDQHTITDVTVGCELNFNRLFPKTAERKTVAQVRAEMADLDAQIAALHREGV